MTTFCTEHAEQPLPGMIRLKPGDVVLSEGNRKHVVIRVNDCNARIIPMEREYQEGETRFGKTFTIPKSVIPIAICTDHDRGYVIDRLKPSEIQDLLESRLPQRDSRKIKTTEAIQETDQTMTAKKSGKRTSLRSSRPARGGLAAEIREAKENSTAETGAAEKPKAKKTDKKKSTTGFTTDTVKTTGELGGIMGYSVTSVLRALGKAGVTKAQAIVILTKNGVKKMPEASVAVQLGLWKSRKPAPLTKEQLDELIAQAPAVAESTDKPAKKKTGKKSGKKSKAKTDEPASEPTAESAAPAAEDKAPEPTAE